MNATMTKGGSRLAEMLAQAPAAAGAEYANWLTTWCQSGASDGPTQPIVFKPPRERTASDILDEGNMQPMCRMLSHHPGAPMAFAEICRQSSGFLRLRVLVEYLKTQSDRPSVTNASDQGSVTAYVSPLHINEVMRGFEIEDSDQAEQEIARLRGVARERVMQDLLGIAGTVSEQAFGAATGTWLRKEYTRRQAAEKQVRAASTATASSSSGSSREQVNDQAISLPAERTGRLAFRAATPVDQQASEVTSTESTAGRNAPGAERPLGFGFRRPAG